MEMFRTFCGRRNFPFHFATKFSPRLLRSRSRVSERIAGAMVGLFLLRQLWVGRDYLCPNCRRPSRIQLLDRAGGLWNQFGARHARAAAAWLDRCDARRNWRLVLVVLWRSALRSCHRLHVWRPTGDRVNCRVAEEKIAAAVVAICSG